MFLHEHPQFISVIEAVAFERKILPGIVEKDYWVMHALWGLQQLGLKCFFKGGTSLSKGYGLIERFSEDLDLMILPPEGMVVSTGSNHKKKHHIATRQRFFNWILSQLDIPGFEKGEVSFDDDQLGNISVRLNYPGLVAPVPALKSGVLLEVGFDQVEPHVPRDITSWAYEKATLGGISNITDNRAKALPVYNFQYTFVEKLQAICRYHKQERAPKDWMRHYYDVFRLLETREVQEFIGTQEYLAHKKKRFKSLPLDLSTSAPITFSDEELLTKYRSAYELEKALYFGPQPDFQLIVDRLRQWAGKL